MHPLCQLPNHHLAHQHQCQCYHPHQEGISYIIKQNAFFLLLCIAFLNAEILQEVNSYEMKQYVHCA